MLVAALTVVTLTGSIAAFSYGYKAGMVTFTSCILISAASLVFTRWRYRQISRLSAYIDRILCGGKALDLRDNYEGELSILKSEIYKVTVMLTSQAELLKQDKNKLADALTDISHQLKTPMTSMGVMIDLLGEDLPRDKKRGFLLSLRTQTERIHWLVTSLLKMAKLDAGAVDMKCEAVVVKELLSSAAEPIAIPVELKEQTLTFTGDDSVTLQGDFNWMREALVNVLKNCLEHTPVGGYIRAEWEDNPLYVQIRVSDTGPGISSKDLPHIFNRFYKGKDAEPGSAGIGLAMAKAVLEKQNGTITAGNATEGGAVFTIRMYKGPAV